MRLSSIRTLLGITLTLAAASARAGDWGTLATISNTMGVSSNRICVGEGLRVGDIGCPSYAPSLTTAGDVSVTGNLSANKFIGDGSGLTGIAATGGDRIVSGTGNATRVVAISNTAFISITQAGNNSAWFDPTLGLVTLGVSSTGSISATNGYFAQNVGVGISAPGGATLQVSGSLAVSQSGQTSTPSLYVSASTGYVGIGTLFPSSTLFVYGDNGLATVATFQRAASSLNAVIEFKNTIGSMYAGAVGSTGDFGIGSSTNLSALGYLFVKRSNGNVGIRTQSPTTTLQVSGSFTVSTSAQTSSATLHANTSGRVGVGTIFPSSSLHVAGNVLITSWTGINFSSIANVTPTAPLEVSGTISATRFIGDGSGLTGIAGSGVGDRITSGTASAIANLNSGISLSAPLDVSGSIKMAGTGAEDCDSTRYGMMRFNPSTGAPQICVNR